MKSYIRQNLIFYKNILSLVIIVCIFSNPTWSSSSYFVNDSFTQQDENENHSQAQLDLDLINENIKKLFTKNKLPKNFDESYKARCSCMSAYSMLSSGRWSEALSYLFTAEKYLEPDSVHILRDIMENKYPQIPAEITQSIKDRFQIIIEAMVKNQLVDKENIDPIDNLYKSYNQRFTANERNLSAGVYEKSNIKTLWYNFTDFLYSKNKYSYGLKNYSISEAQIPLIDTSVKKKFN